MQSLTRCADVSERLLLAQQLSLKCDSLEYADGSELRGGMLDWVWQYFSSTAPASSPAHPLLSGKLPQCIM